MKSKIAALLTVILIGLLIFSCSKNSTGPENNENETVLSDNTLIMNETNLSEPVVDSTGTTYSYTFTGTPPEINVGNVIIGQTDEGYLRKVANVSITGNEITLTTEQACLTDAVEKCSIQDSFKLTTGEKSNGNNLLGLTPVYFAKGVTVTRGGINLNNTELFSGNVGSAHLTAEIKNGSVEFEPIFHRDLNINWFHIQHFMLSAGGNLNFDCDLQLTCDAPVSYSDEILVAEFVSPPFMLGPVPMVVDLSFFAGFETELDIDGVVTYGCDANTSVEYGAEYYSDNGWSTIWNKNAEFNGHQIEWGMDANANARVYIEPELSVRIAGVAGPYLGVEPYLNFDGEFSYPNWQWELDGGFDGNLGFKVAILCFTLADYNTTLLNWETIIASDNGVIQNIPPVISSLTANPENVEVNGTSTITCIATDPDGDNIIYTWESASGSIDGIDSVVTWTAPNSEGNYSVSCTVEDGNGGQDIDSVNITVTSHGQWITIFEDGFESYTSGQFPTSNWQPWHNCSGDPTNNIVTTVQTYSGTKSLQVYGSHGGCWSATAVHLISSLPEKMHFEAYLLASGEAGNGACGHSDIGLGLDHQTEAATDYNFLDVGFGEDMKVHLNIRGIGDELLQSYSLGLWYHVEMEVDTSAKTLIVWINGTSYGPYSWSTGSIPYPLSEYRAVSISSADGKGWADEVVIKKWQE